MDIPYTVDERPDTGLYNGKLGMWLFLASEVMLFGGLFSAYVMIRTGAAEWPQGADLLNVPLATLNTLILITSSMTMVMAWVALKRDDRSRHRRFLSLTLFLGIVFLTIKVFEYSEKFGHDIYPATNVFYALYFTLTGIHFLHILAGVLVLAYHLGPGSRLLKKNARQFTNRIEVTGLYWHFVDLVWLILFPVLYLT